MSDKVDIANFVLEIIKQPVTNGGTRIIYKCLCITCDNAISIRKSEAKNHSGKCKSCAHKKLPFVSLFNTFKTNGKKLENTITYEQFLSFTDNKVCHYCEDSINWIPHPTINGKHISSAYYLDRKDNTKGYIFNNVVVCCTKCNLSKSDTYTYNEWYSMTEYFRRQKNNKQGE